MAAALPAPTRCPKCGWQYAWDGRFCDHCYHPYPRPESWAKFAGLELFRHSHRDPDERGLVWFAVGCLRRAGHLLADDGWKVGLAAAERYAAGEIDQDDLWAALTDVRFDPPAGPRPGAADALTDAVRRVVGAARFGDTRGAVVQFARDVRQAIALDRFPDRDWWSFPLPPEYEPFRRGFVGAAPGREDLGRMRDEQPTEYAAYTALRREEAQYLDRRKAAGPAEEAVQADLYRCVFRYPFATPRFDPRWRTETAVDLAEGIFDDRAFDRLPILADALEDAGCDAADVLAHCRSDRPHVRGCWVVELVLNS